MGVHWFNLVDCLLRDMHCLGWIWHQRERNLRAHSGLAKSAPRGPARTHHCHDAHEREERKHKDCRPQDLPLFSSPGVHQVVGRRALLQVAWPCSIRKRKSPNVNGNGADTHRVYVCENNPHLVSWRHNPP